MYNAKGKLGKVESEDDDDRPIRLPFSGQKSQERSSNRKKSKSPKRLKSNRTALHESDDEKDVEGVDEDGLRLFLDSNRIFLNSFVDEFVDTTTLKNWIHMKSPPSKPTKVGKAGVKVSKGEKSGNKEKGSSQCQQNCSACGRPFEMPFRSPDSSCGRKAKTPNSTTESEDEGDSSIRYERTLLTSTSGRTDTDTTECSDTPTSTTTSGSKAKSKAKSKDKGRTFDDSTNSSKESAQRSKKGKGEEPGQIVMTDAEIRSFMELYGIDLRQVRL